MNQADKDMVTAISVFWDVPEEHITSKYDSHVAAEARYVYMFYLRHYGRLSLSQIGRRTGGFKHDNVIYGLKQVANRADIDKVFYLRLVALNLDQWLKNHRPLFSTK